MVSKRFGKLYASILLETKLWLRKYWLGIIVIGAATIIFFAPLIAHVGSYSPGGDAMFNAWTLARDHACITGDNCPVYANGNIFFPHKDTMLYSETQLSTGLLTLPLSWINDNPIFANNVWTIFSFFLGGFFMYLLAMYLSRGNQIVSILAGLIFAFAPLRMAALWHLQNLCIAYLPLSLLFIFKFFDSRRLGYLAGLFTTLVIIFYGSWYQMIFAGMAVGIVLLVSAAVKLAHWKTILMTFLVLVMAAAATLPLAVEFMRFSKEQHASFSIKDQAYYAASLKDYLIPYEGTVLGKAYYSLRPGARHNAYNPDSYSYHGIVMYIAAAVVLLTSLVLLIKIRSKKQKKYDEDRKTYKLAIVFGVLATVGFIVSLGPVLKLGGSATYEAWGMSLVIPMPWLIVDKLLPQLMFIRAIGRASILMLLALCALLAMLPVILSKTSWWSGWRRSATYATVALLIAIELMPAHLFPMDTRSYAYNLQIPAVYRYIKQHKEIDNIVIIGGDSGYPGEGIPFQQAEWVLWAGYTNRNIFNGYSGFQPPEYLDQYIDFKDLDAKDIAYMRKIDLRYVIIDKQLSSSRPELIQRAEKLLPNKIYEDNRYALFGVK